MQPFDFSRQIILDGFGEEGQSKLKNGRVLVFGAGGLGGIAIPYLAAAGVGGLTIVDPDTVDLSNLHRQIPYTYNDLGRSKVISVAEFARARSPEIEIETIDRKVNESEALELFTKHDIVLDCADDPVLSYFLSDCSLVTKKPVVFGNASSFDGQLFTMLPTDGTFPCWRCLWPMESAHIGGSCGILGVVGPVPGTIGCWQALTAIQYLVGYDVVSGTLIRYSFKKMRQTTLHVPKCPKCDHTLTTEQFNQYYLGDYIYKDSLEHAAQEGFLFLDIRYPDETSEIPGVSQAMHVDMYELLDNPMSIINETNKYMVLCSRGFRAQYTATVLREQGLRNVYAYTRSL